MCHILIYLETSTDNLFDWLVLVLVCFLDLIVLTTVKKCHSNAWSQSQYCMPSVVHNRIVLISAVEHFHICNHIFNGSHSDELLR